jgi:NTE family protein
LRPLYLALSGGGAHAAAHAGVLRALANFEVSVAGIAGVSGGALVAAAWAGGANLERLVEQAAGLHPWMWVRGWGGGLLSGSRLGALIDEFLPVPVFEGLRVPVVVLATDVDTGQAVVLREGNLRDAVRASCSFPGVFPPMLLNGRRLYDGGITEVIPVRLAREMAGEAGVVVAVDVNSGTRWPAADSFVAVALRAGLTLLRGRDAKRAGRRRPGHRPVDGGVRLDASRQDPALLRGGGGCAGRGPAGAPPADRLLRLSREALRRAPLKPPRARRSEFGSRAARCLDERLRSAQAEK